MNEVVVVDKTADDGEYITLMTPYLPKFRTMEEYNHPQEVDLQRAVNGLKPEETNHRLDEVEAAQDLVLPYDHHAHMARLSEMVTQQSAFNLGVVHAEDSNENEAVARDGTQTVSDNLAESTGNVESNNPVLTGGNATPIAFSRRPRWCRVKGPLGTVHVRGNDNNDNSNLDNCHVSAFTGPGPQGMTGDSSQQPLNRD